MIDFPIVDAHVHFWNMLQTEHEWMTDNSPMNRSFFPEDYFKASSKIDVDRIIFVETTCIESHQKKEVAWVTELARKFPRIRAIVAGLSMEKGEAVAPLMEELSGNSIVKGIRRLIKLEAVDFCIQSAFVNAVQLLPEYDFTFDICTNKEQNGNAIKMVEKCPKVKFVVDHIGTPDIGSGTLEPWKSEIKSLSEFDNVCCKASSLATEAYPGKWTLDDLKPYVEHVVDCFGYDRIMFGGDWPVSSVSATFDECVNILDWFLQGSDNTTKRKVFRENAIRFYRL